MDLHDGPAVLSSAAGLSFPVAQEAAKAAPLPIAQMARLAQEAFATCR
jgi:hypothetical protein